MATHVWVLSVALGVTTLLNAAAVARGDGAIERITKPTFLLLLLGLAWSLGEDAPSAPASLMPVLAALGASLLGDSLLLTATTARFLLGQLVLLLGNLAWMWAIVSTPGRGGFPWWALGAVPVLLVVHGRWGRQVVRYSGRQRGAVFLSLLVLVALVLVAAWHGDWVVILGAFVLLVSDLVLGHDRFVLERRSAPVVLALTHELAQVLIVVGLLR